MKKDEKLLIWFNGEMTPAESANINIMTTTAQYGINIFEGVRGYYNKNTKQFEIFRFEEHLKRLFESSKLMRFELDKMISLHYISKKIIEVIKANNFSNDIYIKIGLFLDGEGSWGATEPVSLFIKASIKGRVFQDIIGVDCGVSSWIRISEATIPPRIKAGANYINSRFAHLEAKRNGHDLAIFMNEYGKIAEGTGACIFMVRDGKLVTPMITGSILESITRSTIIELATKELNLQVEERDIDRTELYIAEELFFVGTTIEILPIFSVDGFQISNKRTGKITKLLIKEYFDVVRGINSKYKDWLFTIK